MRFQRASNHATVTFGDDALLGAGGEARIYVLPQEPHLVAKVWLKPTPERNRKVRVMVANPPTDPMAGQDHSSIAWPVDLLYPPGRPESLAGFLMPRVEGMRPIGEFSNPGVRRKLCPLFTWFYLHRTGRNLATTVRALHERGYVIGDLNESNVLVNERALVTFVDTDSFQVWDAEARHMFRCRVGKPEFTPPELQGKKFADINRAPEHDRFGLGVLLFQLLLEGTHPFAGVYQQRGEPPPLELRIASGHFPHGNDPTVPFRPAPTAPDFAVLYSGLRHLFIRCFQDGYFRPTLRPDAQSWQWMIEEAESHLLTCWANAQHLHADHLEQCPWCARAKLLGGRDPFPSVEAVKAGEHLRPPPRRRWSPRTAPRPQKPSLPTPPPIPPSSGGLTQLGKKWRRKRRPRPLLGDRNDWAWMAITLTGLAGAATYGFHWKVNPATFFFCLLALVCGILGEGKSRLPDLDGQGKWLARVSIVCGLVGLLWSMLQGRL